MRDGVVVVSKLVSLVFGPGRLWKFGSIRLLSFCRSKRLLQHQSEILNLAAISSFFSVLKNSQKVTKRLTKSALMTD